MYSYKLSRSTEIYDIISRLSLDLKRMELLRDITFEADLLRRSRFLEKRNMDIDGLFKFFEKFTVGKYLLTASIDNKRYVMYIEDGKIVSSALSDPSSGKRLVGLRALAHFISKLLRGSIQVRVFVIEEERVEEETPTREFPGGETIPIKKPAIERIRQLAHLTVKQRRVIEKRFIEEKKPVDQEKLKELRKKLEDVLGDLLNYHGYKLVNVEIDIKDSDVYIELDIKKRKLFGATDPKKLKKRVEEETEILFNMLDLSSGFKIEIKKL